MKFETTAGLLLSGLRALSPVIERRRRSTIPILETVRFDGRSISGTDLDIEVTVEVPASRAAGTACIAHRPLLNLVRHIPADEIIAISAGEDGATIAFPGARYDLPSLPASDFPEWPSAEMKQVEFDGAGLKKALVFASRFVSTEATRYYLNGVCLDTHVAVATDGHRLGAHPLGFDGEALERCIIPTKVVRMLTAVGAAKSMAVKTDGFPSMALGFDGMSIRTKLIDGTFPDWPRVVPKFEPDAPRVSFDRSELSRVLARMVSLVNIRQPGITLSWDSGRVVAVGKEYLQGTVRERLTRSSSTGAGLACFDAWYLRSILSSFPAEKVTLQTNDSGSPSMWRGDGEAYAVLMPMRSADEGLAKSTLTDWQADELGVAA